MIRILVFPCGSEIGLEIYRSLCYSTHVELIGASSVDDHGRFVYEHYIGGLPHVNDPNFIAELAETVKDHDIDMIFPAHDDVIVAAATAKEQGLLSCEILTSAIESCHIARVKSRTYEALKGLVKVPEIYEGTDSNLTFPVFIKPDVGQGSKGASMASNRAELATMLEKDPGKIVCEYLPGEEFTVDCFTDRHGKLRYAQPRRRERIVNGISARSTFVYGSEFKQIAQIINGALKFRGVWFFQLKKDKNGELTLLEIAPRIAGTSGINRVSGVNLALLTVFDRADYDVSILQNEGSVMVDRALESSFQLNLDYKHVYVDFDDFLILNKKVNPLVISYLYQCLNMGKVLHLLSRHREDIHASLEKYHIDAGMFSEINIIGEGESKADKILEEKAIMLDDSFVERQDAHRKGVPVFDAHMVEALMAKGEN